MKYMLGKWCYF